MRTHTQSNTQWQMYTYKPNTSKVSSPSWQLYNTPSLISLMVTFSPNIRQAASPSFPLHFPSLFDSIRAKLRVASAGLIIGKALPPQNLSAKTNKQEEHCELKIRAANEVPQQWQFSIRFNWIHLRLFAAKGNIDYIDAKQRQQQHLFANALMSSSCHRRRRSC